MMMELGVMGYFWLKDGKFEEIFVNFMKELNLYMKVYKKKDILKLYYWKYNCRIFLIFIDLVVGWFIG